MLSHKTTLTYTLLVLLLVLSLITLIDTISIDESVAALRSLTDLSLSTLTIAVLLTLLNYAIRFLRWQRYLRVASSQTIPSFTHFLIYIGGFSMTTTPGKVGELSRAAWLSDYGVSLSQVTAVFLLERTLDVLALMVLAAVTVTLFFPGLPNTVSIIVIVLIVLLFLCGLAALPYGLRKLSSKQTRLAMVLKQITTTGKMLGPKRLIEGLLLGLLAWFAEGYAFWLILHDIVRSVDLGVLQMVGIYATSLLAGAASMIPGGLVATEVTLSASLSLFDVPAAQALMVVVTTRLITLWFGVLLGFVALLVIGRPKSVGARR